MLQCPLCKARISGRGKHRCSPGFLADLYVRYRLNGEAPEGNPEGWNQLETMPRTKGELAEVIRQAHLAGFTEAVLQSQFGQLEIPRGQVVDYVKRYGASRPPARRKARARSRGLCPV